ncbi:prepilin peptidase [Bacillus sp. B6(2022)]|nr:prepilin peptidase [Bacillus sp. B6(2022)]
MLPLVSYVVLKGSCKHCGTRLSLLYPLVELLTGGLFSSFIDMLVSLLRAFFL